MKGGRKREGERERERERERQRGWERGKKRKGRELKIIYMYTIKYIFSFSVGN